MKAISGRICVLSELVSSYKQKNDQAIAGWLERIDSIDRVEINERIQKILGAGLLAFNVSMQASLIGALGIPVNYKQKACEEQICFLRRLESGNNLFESFR